MRAEHFERVIQRAEELSERWGVELALVMEDLDEGSFAEFHADRSFFSASTIKIPLMMAVLQEEGKTFEFCERLPLSNENRVDFSVVTQIGQGDYSIEEYLDWMMIESCNASTNVLIDRVGADKVNRIFEDLKMEKSVLQRKMMDVQARLKGNDNFTSAKDMAILLRSIYRREYFEEESCRKAIEIMKRCRDFDLLLRYLPRAPVFAHKTGGLDEVNHDVGIFYGKTAVLVSAFTQSDNHVERDSKRVSMLGHIGRWLWEEN